MDKDKILVTHKHYHDINVLRGIAVVLVIWFHASNRVYSGLSTPDF